MLIRTFVSQIETTLSTLLSWNTKLYLARLDNSHLEMIKISRRNKKWFDEEVMPNDISNIENIIGVLKPGQYEIKELPYDEKAVFDDSIWLEENRKELFPNGLTGKDFHTSLIKKQGKAKVILVSKKVVERIQALSGKEISVLLFSDCSDNIVIAKRLLSGVGSESIFYLNDSPHPFAKNIVQRWLVVILFIFILGLSGSQLFTIFLDFRYNSFQEQLTNYSKEKDEYQELQSAKEKLSERLININRYKGKKTNNAANINEMLKMIPDNIWAKSFESENGRMILSLYTTDLKAINGYEKNLEKLRFVEQINALKIEKAKSRIIRKQYGVRKEVFIVELQVEWT